MLRHAPGGRRGVPTGTTPAIDNLVMSGLVRNEDRTGPAEDRRVELASPTCRLDPARGQAETARTRPGAIGTINAMRMQQLLGKPR